MYITKEEKNLCTSENVYIQDSKKAEIKTHLSS